MGITDGLQAVAKVLREADKIEQYQQILDVQEKLLEQQKRILDLETENRNLKESLEIKRKLEHRNNSYWAKDDDTPFCATCFEGNDKAIHMIPWGTGRHRCNVCSNMVETNSTLARQVDAQQEVINNRDFDPYSVI